MRPMDNTENTDILEEHSEEGAADMAQVLTDSEAVPTEVSEGESADDAKEDPRDELQRLRGELEALRSELNEKKALEERLNRELGEFSELFPEIVPSNIPDTVWDSVRNGIPLAAAFALYEKKAMMESARIRNVNGQNASASAGIAGKDSGSEYFTPDEVRAMSREEVRANYSKIVRSMKKWN